MGKIIYNNKPYAGGGSDPTWGNITGTLSDQTDLQNALNGKQATLTFDNVPTNGSNNPVKSDGIYDALAPKVSESLLKDTVGWVGKNLLEIPDDMVSTTISDVTITINRNSNGELTSLVANGTASANITNLFLNTHINLKAGTYWVNGNPSGVTGTSYGLRISNSAFSINTFFEQGKVFSLNSDTSELRVDIRIPQGQVLNNAVFEPMICDVNIADRTFEPYHESVEQTLRDAEAIEGKNLANFIDHHGVAVSGEIDDNATRCATVDPIIIESGKSYRFVASNGANGIIAVWNGSTLVRRTTDIQSGAILDTSGGDRFYMCGYKANTTVTVDGFKPMVIDSNESTDYEPYYIPLKDSKFDRAEQRVLGAKNILPYPYRDTTKTSNVINFVDNKNGTITIKAGTATGGDASFVLHNQGGTFKFADFIGKRCIFSGGLSSNVKIAFWVQGTLNITAQGEEVEFTMPDIGSKEWNMTLYVTQNTVISADTVIKPMIRLASDPDDTYVPYAMTNAELTESAIPSPTVDGTVITSIRNNNSIVLKGHKIAIINLNMVVGEYANWTTCVSGLPKAKDAYVSVRVLNMDNARIFSGLIDTSGNLKLIALSDTTPLTGHAISVSACYPYSSL